MVLSSMLVAASAFAQGQVNFAARVVGVYDAPVFLGFVVCGAKAEGPAYMVQLYAGATASNLAPIGAPLPLGTGADAGYWTATTETINTVDESGNAIVQVRAWRTSAGATYEAVYATGPSDLGTSAFLSVKPTQAPDGPAPLTGLSSFGIIIDPSASFLSPCPEPPTMALGALGSLALLFRRMRVI